MVDDRRIGADDEFVGELTFGSKKDAAGRDREAPRPRLLLVARSEDSWRTIAPSLPAGASDVTTWDGARMVVVFPMFDGDGESPRNVAAAYDAVKDAWTTLPLPSAAFRVMPASAAIPRAAGLMPIAMFGGVDFIGEEPRPDPGTMLLPADTDGRTAFGAKGPRKIDLSAGPLPGVAVHKRLSPLDRLLRRGTTRNRGRY